ncbi:hypothetical protein ACFQ07_30605, partial [Actinomadura adrarensis]
VDGLHVRPSVRHGVLAGLEETALKGVVVNLTGENAPASLSVDRRQILSDVSETVESLLRSALDELLTEGRDLLNVSWLSAVTEASPRLADLIAVAAGDRGLTFRTRRGDRLPLEAGFFLQDSHLVLDGDEPDSWDDRPGYNSPLWSEDFALGRMEPPDHVLLWRLGAHGEINELGRPAVELEPHHTLAALPSDVLILGSSAGSVPSSATSFSLGWIWPEYEQWRYPGHFLWVAMLTGASPRQVARRAVELGWSEVDPHVFSPQLDPDHLDLALLSTNRTGRPQWLDTEEGVLPGHLVSVALQFGVDLAQLGERILQYGFRLSSEMIPEGLPAPLDLRLLSWTGKEASSWIDPEESVPACHTVRAAAALDLGTGEVCRRLREYGFAVDPAGLPARPGEADLALFSWDMDWRERAAFDLALPVPPAHIVRGALALGMSNQVVADRLAAYGIRVPGPMPERPAKEDMDLLSMAAKGGSPWWPAGARVPLWRLLLASARTGLTPERAAARLAEYGMEVPHADLPSDPEPFTARICSQDIDGLYPWLDERTPVTRGHILRTSLTIGMPTTQVKESLARCGFTVPPDVPEQLDHRDIRLMSESSKSIGAWIPIGKPVSLAHLFQASRDLGMSLDETAQRLRWLGMDVPDVAETIERATRRVPRSR